MTSTYKIKDLPIISIETATGKARGLLETAKRQLGFVPNMYGAMANEPALLESYTATYALFRAECAFTPAEQEVIFLVISRNNACDYCMAAHSVVADKMSKVQPEVTDAIRDGRPMPDPKIQALATFTKIMFDTRGRPSEADVQEFLAEEHPRHHPRYRPQDVQQLRQPRLPYPSRWRLRLTRVEGPHDGLIAQEATPSVVHQHEAPSRWGS